MGDRKGRKKVVWEESSGRDRKKEGEGCGLVYIISQWIAFASEKNLVFFFPLLSHFSPIRYQCTCTFMYLVPYPRNGGLHDPMIGGHEWYSSIPP